MASNINHQQKYVLDNSKTNLRNEPVATTTTAIESVGFVNKAFMNNNQSILKRQLTLPDIQRKPRNQLIRQSTFGGQSSLQLGSQDRGDGGDVTFDRMEEDVRIQLYQAIDANDLEGVLDCIEEGVNLDAADSNGQTPLILAAEKGHLDIVTELLNRNVDVNAKDEDGWTALIAASKEGFHDVVSQLLENAAKYNIPDLGGWTPLIWAAYKGHVEIVNELLRYGANPEDRGQHNMTALIWAAGRGHTSVISELINSGAKPEVADKYGTSALVWACRKGHYAVTKILLSAGASVNTVGTHGWTSLIMAAKGGYLEVVNVLLEENPNINAVDHDGLSALAWAAKEGFNDILAKLLERGAFINVPDRRGDSALILASKEGHAGVVRTLIESYGDIEMVDVDGKTSLYHGVEKGHVGVVRELLIADANTEVMNQDGETPLLRGAKRKHTQCVKLLLGKGANVAATDKKGDTPLHVAIRNGYNGLCEALLNDPKNSKLLHTPNKAGETPYSLDLKNKPSILSSVFSGNHLTESQEKSFIQKNDEFLYRRYLKGRFFTCLIFCAMIERSSANRIANKFKQVYGYSPVLPISNVETRLDVLDQLGDNDLEQMDYHNKKELLLSTVADFLIEPSFRTPLSVGIYSRWGSGKSTQMQRLMELLQEHIQQSPMQVYSITASIVATCILIAITVAIIVWTASNSIVAGVICAVVLAVTSLAFLTFTRIALVSTRNSLHSVGIVLTKFIYRCKWFFQLVYSVPPCIQDVRPFLRVHLITVDLTRTVLVGDNPMTSLVNFIRELNDAIEADVGIVIPRLYRIFQSTPYRTRPEGNPSLVTKWKKSLCCIPSFFISVIVLLCFLIGLILYGIFELKGPSAVVAIQIACVCVLGGFLLANILRLFVIIYCLILPMKQRVNFVSTQAGVQEDTFISVVKQEMELCVDMLESIDGFAQRQTRIIVNIDLLDSLEQIKVLSLINSINMIISEECYPFAFVISVDPRLLIKAVDQNVGMLQVPFMNSYDYLRNLVDLPFYIIDQTKIQVDNLIPLELRSSIEDQPLSDAEETELEWDDNADLNGDIASQDASFASRGQLSNGLKPQSSRSVKFPADENEGEKENGMEDISNLIRTNTNGTLSDIKRIMNIVSLSGRVLRNTDVNFIFTRLAIWVNLCDRWPHKASWIVLLCSDATLALPDKMSVRKLYNALGYGMPTVGDTEESVGNANSYFDTFIASHKPVITIRDVRTFTPCMFYLDPTIRSLMVDYMLAIKSGSLSKTPSIQHQYSSRSNFPLSPCDSSKFMWRGVVDDQYLSKMSVEDVVTQLSEVDGMDLSFIPTYREKLIENNINGRVLVTCDLNELRDAMQMKFGDWQLFKAWVMASRYKDGSCRSDKLSFYRPLSRGNSCADGSQSESIPESPKQSSTCSTGQRNGNRLPALDESPDGSKAPYAPHSPKSSPQASRKSTKRKIGKMMSLSLSQDGETISHSALTDHHSPNPGWHRSSDSGFASTDVDPNSKITPTAQTGHLFSDNDHLVVSTSMIHRTPKYMNDVDHDTIAPVNHIPVTEMENAREPGGSGKTTGLGETDIAMHDTWNEKEGDSDVTNHVLSGGSSQELLVEHDTGTEDYSAGNNNNNTMRLSAETSFGNASDIALEDVRIITHNKKAVRPPSLSDVPLPPQSMLDNTALDENNADLPSPPSSSDRKMAFQYAAKLRGMSSYASDES